MKYLLDTHTLIWYLLDKPEISRLAKSTIDSEPECFYSYVSFWEIAIKQQIGKIDMKTPVPEIESACRRIGLQKASVSAS